MNEQGEGLSPTEIEEHASAVDERHAEYGQPQNADVGAMERQTDADSHLATQEDTDPMNLKGQETEENSSEKPFDPQKFLAEQRETLSGQDEPAKFVKEISHTTTDVDEPKGIQDYY